MIRTVAAERKLKNYEDEYSLFRYISDLLIEVPKYGRVVVKLYTKANCVYRVAQEVYTDEYLDVYLLFRIISELLKTHKEVLVKVYIESRENRKEKR